MSIHHHNLNCSTHLDESYTHHFQLGITKVFKFEILAMEALAKIFQKCLLPFWTHQVKLLQVHVSLLVRDDFKLKIACISLISSC